MRTTSFIVILVLVFFMIFIGIKVITLMININNIEDKIEQIKIENNNLSIYKEKLMSPYNLELQLKGDNEKKELEQDDLNVVENQ